MDRDGVLRAVGLAVPDAAVELAGRKNLARVAHQKAQDLVFRRREGDRLPVAPDLLGLFVKTDRPDRERPVVRLSAAELHVAPQLGSYAGAELDRIEGLRDVVVRPDVEPEHLVGVLALGREQDDGDVALLAQLRRGGDAVERGHHHVHEHQMDLFAPQQLQRLAPVEGREGRVALGLEVYFQRRDDVPFVVADQNVVHFLTSRAYLTIKDFKFQVCKALRFS